ncbi:MAG: hypothetical protein GF331_00210 [Chitinivibrionales bacterium]|nr:hypothetical protein [Chitinivibrionales bacterium]
MIWSRCKSKLIASTGMGVALMSLGAMAATSYYTEIESQSPKSPWRFEESLSGYNGTGYFYWTGSSNYNNNNKSGVITYKFNLSESGTYIIDFRGRRNSTDECVTPKGDLCNDIFVKINSGPWSKHMIKRGRSTWDTWVWDDQYEKSPHNVTTHQVSLSAGQQTLQLNGRSREVNVDAFRVYKEGTTPPTSPTDNSGGGGTTNPTVMVAPASGTSISMGSTITLQGTGDDLSWSYDANSDGMGEIQIGTGTNVSFEVPTGITGAQEITIKLSGSGGSTQRTFGLTPGTTSVIRVHQSGVSFGRPGAAIRHGIDGRRINESIERSGLRATVLKKGNEARMTIQK